MNVSETRKRRRLAVKSALAAVVLGAAGGGIYYSTSAATAGETPVGAAFGCVLPGGDRVDVPIEFGVGIPNTATAGTQVTAKPSAKIVLPATAVDKLRAGGETALDASLTPAMTLVEGTTRTELKATPLAVKAMTLPAQGDLNLTLEGAPVAFTPKAAGTAQVELTGLTAQMLVGTTEITCTATTDSGALGTFDVTAAAPAPAAPPAQAQALPDPGVGTLADPEPLRVNFEVTVVAKPPKLQGAQITLRGTLKTLLPITLPVPPDGNDMTGELLLDPAKNTYLVVFRFMPVFNDIYATEGTVSGKVKVILGASPVGETNGVSRVKLRVDNVWQGGTASGTGVHLMDPGVDCHTAGPMEVPITGNIGLGQGVETDIKSTATVPPFTGCRGKTGEDLSRLFSGLVSGPGTEVLIHLKSLCIGCPK
ncbi:hypothetical protein UO65_3123 [Actinokineospora spheciospongiae]|uniref:Uncharacterized protein n=1 Tax=Actinokineospora spheciospongiae TaxID=909613 RepID=W7IXN2_9PSEU|nr:hypothetical protein [Actinokineospora spheciospongiae]EWC61602.1 hypothetical protein UO65_3123 [Actinokineospora spheciospongiae]